MRKAILTLLLSVTALFAAAQKDTIFFALWENGAPTDNGLTGEENVYKDHVSNVTQPTLTVYLPEHPNGKAVLACPGGGYLDVWLGTEGHNLAKWYTEQGFAYGVLKYRLPNGHKEVPLEDVHEAMRIMRAHQEEYGFTRLGIQGCSAGGHLAATAATHYRNAEERPDFQILFYPVITMDPSYTHMGTHDNLLGKRPSKKLEKAYSLDRCVTTDTPPAFIMASSDDGLVPVRNSIDYYNTLLAHSVSAALHLYPVGGHGWCAHDWQYKNQWKAELQEWLRDL